MGRRFRQTILLYYTVVMCLSHRTITLQCSSLMSPAPLQPACLQTHTPVHHSCETFTRRTSAVHHTKPIFSWLSVLIQGWHKNIAVFNPMLAPAVACKLRIAGKKFRRVHRLFLIRYINRHQTFGCRITQFPNNNISCCATFSYLLRRSFWIPPSCHPPRRSGA